MQGYNQQLTDIHIWCLRHADNQTSHLTQGISATKSDLPKATLKKPFKNKEFLLKKLNPSNVNVGKKNAFTPSPIGISHHQQQQQQQQQQATELKKDALSDVKFYSKNKLRKFVTWYNKQNSDEKEKLNLDEMLKIWDNTLGTHVTLLPSTHKSIKKITKISQQVLVYIVKQRHDFVAGLNSYDLPGKFGLQKYSSSYRLFCLDELKDSSVNQQNTTKKSTPLTVEIIPNDDDSDIPSTPSKKFFRMM